MHIGAIADDITGATDLASTLCDAGLEVVQSIGVPAGPLPPAEAVVVSQKIRTCPPGEAVCAALSAGRWLRERGAGTIYFKYCSTFDSTEEGNIGPVTAALLDECTQAFTIACPAYPPQARTVYQGHLFVGDRLLSESGMRNHPLTPMTDANLVRVLGRQMAERVGLVPLGIVRSGAGAVRRCFDQLARSGHRVAIADAVADEDLDTLAEACATMPFVTGAAGLAHALARRATRERDQLPVRTPRMGAAGPAVVLSGSCSEATREQVRRFTSVGASRQLDPREIVQSADALPAIVAWACEHAARHDVLVYSSADPVEVQRIQATLGRERAAQIVEGAFRTLARALRDAGVTTFVVAGGETSGAVLEALEVRLLGFGRTIEPGVPATCTLDPPGLFLALKSGNFGSADFFVRAIEALRGTRVNE